MNQRRCHCARAGGDPDCRCAPPLYFCPPAREEGPTFQVTFLKLGSLGGEPLSGAVFSLTRNGTVVARAISDENGVINLGQIAPGKYRLFETEAPPGYTPLPPADVIIDPDGTVTRDGQPASAPIVNIQTLSTIIVHQISPTGTALQTENLSVPPGAYGPITPTPISGYQFIGLSPESAPASGTIAPGETLVVLFLFQPA